MAVVIRKALATDIPHMAYVAIQAFGGFAEVMYEGAVPDRSVQQIMEERFGQEDTTTSIAHSWIAEDGGTVLGGMHAFPMDLLAQDPPDCLIPEERYPYFAPFDQLHADGSYYVNAITLYPAFQGRGVASRLMEKAETEARAQAFDQLSLHVFAENRPAVRRYKKIGYQEKARHPVIPHPYLRYGGDLLIMAKRI